MTTSLKGIFKYFTQIFDEKEQEMQIGHPTDVKHVAHIGWDGSSSSDPTWMNDFKSGPGLSTEALISNGQLKTSAKDFYLGEASKPAATVKEPLPENTKEKPKQKSRRRSSADGATDLDSSSNRGSSEGSTRSGRHRSKTSMESPIRSQKSNQGIESPCDDRAGIPKPSRRKKSKGTSSGEGSSRSSRSKARTHSDDDLANNERCLSSVVEGNEEVKG